MIKQYPYKPLYLMNIVTLNVAGFAAFFFPFHASYLGFMAFHYLWFGLASSLYYHRGLTHRSYKMVTPLQIFFLLGGLIGLSGDPIRWAAIHRYHHQRPDHADDIHSPLDGFWYAYAGWTGNVNPEWIKVIRPTAQDLHEYWFLKYAEGDVITAFVHFVYVGIGIYLFGLGTVLWTVYLPLLLSYNFAWMLIASLGHIPKLGSREFNTPDRSTNLTWLGPFSFGEAFHNNHHQYPSRAGNNLHWYQIDLSSYLIWIFEKLRLVRDVVWERPHA